MQEEEEEEEEREFAYLNVPGLGDLSSGIASLGCTEARELARRDAGLHTGA